MTNALQLVPSSFPSLVGGLDGYLARVNKIPLLSAEQERNLAHQYRQNGDLMAAQQLVLSHLRYVVRIARTYTGYGLALADLIQEGTIGLMKAVKRFDPDMGVRLVSFAVHWIKAEIHEFVIRNWRLVKIATTKAQRKLFFNLRQAKKRLGWFSAEEVQHVAQDLGVSPEEVIKMEMRLNAQEDSFDPLPTSEDEGTTSAAHYLPAPNSDPSQALAQEDWEIQSQQKLQNALTQLDPRSLDIVSKRWLTEEKASLKDLAQKYAVSIERVRQLEKNALEKLRGFFSPEDYPAMQ